jgi:hypothetical protein
MNPKLFTMLNPKTVNLLSNGGQSTFTVSDFNFVCSGADPIGLEVLRRKWGTGTKEDFSVFLEEVFKKSRHWNIPERREEKLKGLFDLILFEYTSLPVCSHCRGRGERLIKGILSECQPCRGTGSYRLKNAEKARYIGIKKQSWTTWESRYRDIQCLLEEHVHKALTSINERMRDES